MNLVRFHNPHYNVNRNLVDDLFTSIFNSDYYDSSVKNCGCQPANNIFETENEFMVELQVPGFKKEEVQISVLKNVLTVKAGKEEVENAEKQQEQYKYVHREFTHAAFEKQYKLPATVDAEKISARFENGILILALPKKAEEVEKTPVEIAIV